MKIIPVLDLMHGEVVHARLGQRQHYQPIQSQLCNSSDPVDVANALLELYPFECIYIADLNAITGQGNHESTIAKIQALQPNIEVWLDAGIKNTTCLETWTKANVMHVIGSENIDATNDLMKISQLLHGNFVLSLDFSQDKFLGYPELQSATELWPKKVIAMTLGQVGSQLGADMNRLLAIKKLAGNREIYAAGGIRNNQDIHLLQDLNIAGALVATALHDKNLNPNII